MTLTRLAGPLAAVINVLPDDEKRATRDAVEAGLEQFRQGDEVVVPAACWRRGLNHVSQPVSRRRRGDGRSARASGSSTIGK